MKQLEKRVYSRQEIAEITGRDSKSDHFARNVKNDLSKWGYEYEYSRRSVTITKVPATAEERLAEIMMRQFGLDIQVDVKAFAYFLYLLLTMPEFGCMPWSEREAELAYQFGISIAESTLRRWSARLLDGDHLHKTKPDNIYWKTEKHDGIAYREAIDSSTDEDYAKYKSRRKELIDLFMLNGMDKSKAWGEAFKQLWQEFGCCYYACPHFTLNAIGDEQIDEICDIVTEICGKEE